MALLHCHCSPEPLNPSPLNAAAVEYYRKKGAIARHDKYSKESGADVFMTTDKGRAWVRALCSTQAPLSPEELSARETRLRKIDQYYEFHKDYYGWSPDTVGMSGDEIVAAYDKISADFAEKKKTSEGREWLRARHWCVDEPERDAESEKDGSAEFGE